MLNRRIWFDWHSWAGFQLSILLSFVLVTGTLATVSLEIDALINPAMRSEGSPPEQLNWGAMLEASQAAFPDARITRISAPRLPWLNAQIMAQRADGERFRIFVDTATEQVAGTGRWRNWQRFFRQTHRHLMLPVKWGVTIVGLLSFPLLVSLVTSFAIYKRWWRGFRKWPRNNSSAGAQYPENMRKARRYWGDWHRFMGVWSLWFVPLIAVTGIWYLVEQWGLNANYPQAAQVSKMAVADPQELSGAKLNRIIERSSVLYQELEVEHVLLDQNKGAIVLLQGQATASLVRARANSLAFAVDSEELIDMRKGEDLSLHVRISEAADPLHFGTLGGAPTRYLWFVFGVMLSALSITGVYLYGLRIYSKVSQRSERGALSSWLIAWQRMSIIPKWFSAVIVALTLYTAAIYFLA